MSGGAGCKVVGYETARANLGTLIEQVKAAESALTTERRTVEELRAGLSEACDRYDRRDPPGVRGYVAADLVRDVRTLAGPR